MSYENLVQLGVIDYCVIKENFVDKELVNVFLYRSEKSFEDFTLQVDEVSGIVRAKFTDFAQLWFGERDEVEVTGYEINSDGIKHIINENVNRDKFVPHQETFYKEVILKMQEQIK